MSTQFNNLRLKLVGINVALLLWLTGLIWRAGYGSPTGIILIIMASALLAVLFLRHLFQCVKQKRLHFTDVVLHGLALVFTGIVGLNSLSVAIDVRLISTVPWFGQWYPALGLLFTGLFFVYSRRAIKTIEPPRIKQLLTIGLWVFAVINLLGMLGFARVVPGTVPLLYFSWVWLVFCYLVVVVIWRFGGTQPTQQGVGMALGVAVIFLLFWAIRTWLPGMFTSTIAKNVFYLGFAALVVLPLSIVALGKKTHAFAFLAIFAIYTTLSELYFIDFNNDFNYLVDVGPEPCIGFENATYHPTVYDPQVPRDQLFAPATQQELTEVLDEWANKDFTPQNVQVLHAGLYPNGDSLKLFGHTVNGQQHYGMVRIPQGLDVANAPIMVGLIGGGTQMDVVRSSFLLNRLPAKTCPDQLNNYLLIAPAMRGNVIRGNGFCYRAEGYPGDAWLGPAEDATAFLEVVKQYYNKPHAPVLAAGTSRGATVALIMGALSNRVHYAMAVSTHTNFHNTTAYNQQPLHYSYPAVFYTPQADLPTMRRRLIAASPAYFAHRLPPFEIHQGTTDGKTTVLHAELMQQQLANTNRPDSTSQVYIYEGQGHGYYNPNTTCQTLRRFADEAAQLNEAPAIEVHIPTPEEEARYIWRTLYDIPFFDRQGYSISLPRGPLMDTLLAQARQGQLNEAYYPRLEAFMRNKAYRKADYLAAQTNIQAATPRLRQLLVQLQGTSYDWPFKVYDTYTVNLTLYGPGGSYDPDQGSIHLFTTPDGRYKMYDSPLFTLIHEMVHIGVEQSVVQALQLPHPLKERMVDRFVVLSFGNAVAGYTIQPMGNPALDQVLQTKADLLQLKTLMQQFIEQ